MNTTIEIYLGAPIEVESERLFLSRLCAELREREQSALIFANFLLPPRKPIRQIDFLVILADVICHVELKNLSAPVTGTANGQWHLRLPDGAEMPLDSNPYRQALECKYKISDQMHDFARRHDSVPQPPNGGKFFKLIESTVCVYPDLLPGSNVPNDVRVRVLGYAELLKLITTNRENPGWSTKVWREFATYLSLERQDDSMPASEKATAVAEDEVVDFSRRFRESYGNGLSGLVATSIEENGATKKSNEQLNVVSSGEHAQLVGPSGYGKSHHVIHLSLNALDEGRITVIALARDYAGRLSKLLDRSIAHLSPHTAIQFFEMATSVGRPLTVVIDGFNECPSRLRDDLLRDLQAFYLRWHIPIVFTTQSVISLPKGLSGRVLRFCDLTSQERAEILRAYSSNELPSHAAELCEPFRSAFELSLAAGCITEIARNPTRFRLFDAFVRKRVGDTIDAEFAIRIFSEIADRMRIRLCSTLPVHEAWAIAEQVLTNEQLPLVKLQEIVSYGLINVQQGNCAFRHELLQRFFEAIALCRRAADLAELAAEMRKPAHHPLLQFILGMQTEPTAFRWCLDAAASTDKTCTLVSKCLLGEFGDIGRQITLRDAKRVLHDAERDLENFAVDSKPDPHQRASFVVEIKNCREWSAYECALIDAIASCLPRGLFLDDVLRLVAKTEDVFFSALKAKVGAETASKYTFQSTLFWHVFVSGIPRHVIPAAAIVQGNDGRCDLRTQAPVANQISRLLADPEELTIAQLYLCLCLIGTNAQAIETSIPTLLRYCLESGIYHLQTEVLRLAQFWANRLTEAGSTGQATRKEVVKILASFEASNVILSTTLVETMKAFDMLESPVTVSDVRRELKTILSAPNDAIAQHAADRVVSCIFEDIYDDAYYEAIEDLSPGEKTTLYTRAALAVPAWSSTADFVLGRLLEESDPRSIPAFQRFAAELDDDAPCRQDRTTCFVCGHIGCAQFLDVPPKLEDLGSDDRRAWQHYGEIIFWLSKPDLSAEDIRTRCKANWMMLESELVFEAIDPLREFGHSLLSAPPRKADEVVQRLFSTFGTQIRGILEYGLKNPQHVSSIDKQIPTEYSIRENTTFIIHTLGQIGASDTVGLLEAFVEDDYHGRDAVNAIRRINSNEPFRRLTTIFRFP